jgi:hypothetical protein
VTANRYDWNSILDYSSLAVYNEPRSFVSPKRVFFHLGSRLLLGQAWASLRPNPEQGSHLFSMCSKQLPTAKAGKRAGKSAMLPD